MIFDKEMLEKIRTEFPRAELDWKGRKRIFFDNAAGSLVLRRAALTEAKARIDYSSNVGATYDESKDFEGILFDGRKAVAELLNVPSLYTIHDRSWTSPNTIVTGHSATGLLFTLSYAIGKELNGRENIVTTDLEHFANVSPWLELEERGLCNVRFARVDKDSGTLNMDHLKSLVDDNTKVVAVTASSNLLGTKTPLKEIAKIAREVNAYFVVDAVQYIPHTPIDVQTIDCDFLVLSGYKFFTSKISFLYGKYDLLKKLKPYKIHTVLDEETVRKWNRGTPDQALVASMVGVADYLTWLADQVSELYNDSFKMYSGRVRSLKVSMDTIDKYERELSKVMLFGSDDIPGLTQMSHVKVYGITDPNLLEKRNPTFGFKVKNMTDRDVEEYLWKKHSIALRSGNHWSRAVAAYNVSSMIRASLIHCNTVEEICTFLKALNELR